jgi:hypothetical protein
VDSDAGDYLMHFNRYKERTVDEKMLAFSLKKEEKKSFSHCTRLLLPLTLMH